VGRREMRSGREVAEGWWGGREGGEDGEIVTRKKEAIWWQEGLNHILTCLKEAREGTERRKLASIRHNLLGTRDWADPQIEHMMSLP